jgi:hypothetical protein
MKTYNDSNNPNLSKPTFSAACVSSCKKLLAQMDQAKRGLLNDLKDRFQSREHLLRLALKEAEAMAWQTGFPQLVFADLALEKAQAAAARYDKQRGQV